VHNLLSLLQNFVISVLEQAVKDQLAKEEEVSGLQRRVILLDDDIVRSEARLAIESKKLEDAAKLADEVEKKRKVLENQSMLSDERIDSLDSDIISATAIAIDSSRKMEEAGRKLAMTQVDLERTLVRCDECEVEIQELEDDLKIVGQNMKTLELSETDALSRQEKYEETIRTLSCNLKMTEIQAAHAEREAAKMQKELDNVVEELEEWKDKYQEICTELEQTFNEMSGY
jgi:chromosome segregation ATPase